MIVMMIPDLHQGDGYNTVTNGKRSMTGTLMAVSRFRRMTRRPKHRGHWYQWAYTGDGVTISSGPVAAVAVVVDMAATPDPDFLHGRGEIWADDQR
jgi:hypothetical protein